MPSTGAGPEVWDLKFEIYHLGCKESEYQGPRGTYISVKTKKNVLAMSTLIKLEWSMQLATTSVWLYHCDTHTFVRASVMHGRYYVSEHDLSCLLLKITCESKEAANAAYTGGSENTDHDDEAPQLVDVTYNEAERNGNPLLAARLKVWNTGEQHSDLLRREMPLHRMMEARATITRELVN